MRPSRSDNRPLVAMAAAGLALVVIFVVSLPFIRVADNAAGDLLVTTVSPWTAPPSELVMVTVTEDTLKAFPYRSPIDRGFLAGVVTHILAAEPKAIGIDILFDQASEPAKDETLRAVLKTATRPVVVAHADAANGLTVEQSTFLEHYIEGLTTGASDLAKNRGDGTVRNFMPGHRRGGAWLPAFTSALAATQGIASPDSPFALTYYRTANGEPFAFPRYPAQTVALLPPAWFKDKYVLIGTDLPASDRHRTPFALLDGPDRGNLAGIVIHAHSLAQLIAGDRLVAVHGAGLVAVIALLAGLSLAVAYINVGPYLRIFLVLVLLAALWTGTVVLFHYRGILMPLALPSLAIAFVNGLASTHVWYRDRQRRKFIESAFSRYVSPAYVRTLIDHPEQLRLGGQRREVTYVFTDIAGFTGLAEATEPQILSGLLNRYLDGLCGLFLAHGATLDKIVGDAVVGFFGAPVDQPDHADRAVALMLAVDGYCQSFRAAEFGNGHHFGITRIGAHTGPVIIGNFGGSQFFDYTGFGDNVNIAARLEGANKYFGTRICVSAAVATLSPSHRFRPIASVVLKGRSGTVDVLEPLAPHSIDEALMAGYGSAFSSLERCESAALAAFEALNTNWPHDLLVQFHLNRLRRGETGATITLNDK